MVPGSTLKTFGRSSSHKSYELLIWSKRSLKHVKSSIRVLMHQVSPCRSFIACYSSSVSTSRYLQFCHIHHAMMYQVYSAWLAEQTVSVSTQGSVQGHEHEVLQQLHKQLRKQNVMLKVFDDATHSAEMLLVFHRFNQRLPVDELESLLTPVKGFASYL